MSDKLKCGCGGKINIVPVFGSAKKQCFISCEECCLESGAYDTEAEAISAFRLATRADIIPLAEVVDLQKQWNVNMNEGKDTLTDLRALCIPFRDKYKLTDTLVLDLITGRKKLAEINLPKD